MRRAAHRANLDDLTQLRHDEGLDIADIKATLSIAVHSAEQSCRLEVFATSSSPEAALGSGKHLAEASDKLFFINIAVSVAIH